MKKRMTALVLLLLLALCTGALAEGNWLENRLGRPGKTPQQEAGNVALLTVEGELFTVDYTYDHRGTLDAIAQAEGDDRNEALLVYLNTPGGGIYEGDELYHALMMYKQHTGRPVYAYMANECCSAGVLAAMGADTIMASRMTITGSVGVYMETVSEAGLLELLGIERQYVATGENKVSGYPELTQAQKDIMQAMVDESFALFKKAIADARGLTEEQMAAFADGRLLTASQAKKAGLVDEILYYDEAVEKVLALHPGCELTDITPEWAPGMGELLNDAEDLFPDDLDDLLEDDDDADEDDSDGEENPFLRWLLDARAEKRETNKSFALRGL